MEPYRTETVDPFEGWTMASVGCHWSRQLPDGRMVHMSSGSNGYSLTVNFERTEYRDLAAALAGYDEMVGLI
jgi:hypothetical protein